MLDITRNLQICNENGDTALLWLGDSYIYQCIPHTFRYTIKSYCKIFSFKL